MEDCLAPTPFGLGCDNMSVIIITLNGNGTVERYRDPALKKLEIKASPVVAEAAAAASTTVAESPKPAGETTQAKEEALVEEASPATPVSDTPEIMSPSTVQATTAFPTGNSSADDEDEVM